MKGPIQIVFDKADVSEGGPILQFVEVEQDGVGIRLGEWKEREDGCTVLEFSIRDAEEAEKKLQLLGRAAQIATRSPMAMTTGDLVAKLLKMGAHVLCPACQGMGCSSCCHVGAIPEDTGVVVQSYKHRQALKHIYRLMKQHDETGEDPDEEDLLSAVEYYLKEYTPDVWEEVRKS